MGCSTVDCRLEQILEALRASQARDVFDVWALLLIPAVAAAGSITIALASWLTARRATQIAHDAATAEASRAQAESERVAAQWAREYEARLDDRLMLLIEAFGQYGSDADAWVRRATDLELRWSGHPDDTPYEDKPTTAVLVSRLQAAMLVARGDDRVHLAQVDGYVGDMLRSASFWKTANRCKFMMTTIRKWRDGSVKGKTFAARVKRRRNSMALDVDAIPQTPKATPVL